MTSVIPLPDRPPADSLSAQVAEEVRALIARRRTSANRVRQQLGWTQSYISRRVSGTTPFDVEDLAKLADLLQVPVTAFFPRSTRPLAEGGGRLNTHINTRE